MKKFLGILLAFVGLLLSAAGIAGVVLIGSDDTVDSPTTTLKLAGAKAVVSTPGLLAFKDTTMRLTAESVGGSVFIGQAHPIDAKSYLSTSPTFTVTKVDTSGMSGQVVKGDARTTLPDPTKQSFWTARATGTGKQTLVLRLDGTPTEYVIMPLGKGGDVTVTSGIQIKNGFTLSIAAIVVGVLAFVAGLLLIRRRTGATLDVPAAHTADEPVVAPDSDTNTSAAASRTMGRVVTIGMIGVLVPALAGCGMVPTKVEAWKSDALTKPAMADKAEAVAAMKDYDVRNNAAIKESARAYDPVAWAKADTGMVYAQDRLGTAVRKMLKDKDSTGITHTVRSFYSPAFATYPMYSIVNLDRSSHGRVSHSVAAMSKEGASTPWLMVANAPYTMADLPKPVAPERAMPLTDGDKATLLKRVGDLTKQLSAGKGALVSGELANVVGEYMSENGKPASFRLWSSDSDQFGPRGSVQAVKVGPLGTLAVVSFQADTIHDAGAGKVWDTAELNNNYLKATGQVGSLRHLHVRTGVTAVLLLDAKGGVKPLAVDADGLPL